MKRLRKQYADFNSFESNISIDKTKLIDVLNKKDSRLNEDNAIFYNGLSPFGGVYIDTMHQGDKQLFYVVDIIAFENVLDVTKNEDKTDTSFKSFVGIVATFIDYTLPDENNLFSFQYNDSLGQYAEVFPAENGKALREILKYKNNVTVNGLTLKYIAPSFIEALDSLSIAH